MKHPNFPTVDSPPTGVDQHATAQIVRLQLLKHYAQVVQLLTDELLATPVLSQPISSAAPIALSVEPPPPQAAVVETPEDSATELEAALTLFETRSMSDDPFVALWLSGIYIGGLNLVLCIGLSLSGYRRVLGFEACSPEDRAGVTGLLESFTARGLSADEGLLCILPSGTGLQRAVREVLGPRVAVQRCLTTKLAQVTDGLPEDVRADYRQRLRQAWDEPNVKAAEAALMAIHADLSRVNRAAAKVLMENMQDTLTIQRIGLLSKTAQGLRVVNCVHTLGRKLRTPARAVTYQRERLAQAILDHESRWRRMAHWAHLGRLRDELLNLTAHT